MRYDGTLFCFKADRLRREVVTHKKTGFMKDFHSAL